MMIDIDFIWGEYVRAAREKTPDLTDEDVAGMRPEFYVGACMLAKSLLFVDEPEHRRGSAPGPRLATMRRELTRVVHDAERVMREDAERLQRELDEDEQEDG